MTPEQRMEFMVKVVSYGDAKNPKLGMKRMQALISFVEHLEFKAHCAGQDHERETHQEFYINCEPRVTEV